MPRYEYYCSACEDKLIIAHMSDEKITECPTCKSEESLKKMVSRFMSKSKSKPKSATGDLTENFIKEAKKELKQQKKELLEKT